MGVVYKARHLALKRTVALKMVLAGGHAGAHELARFRIEAEAVARLAHPNIVQIHEVGEADGHPYCALEFVEGGNLAGKIGGKTMPAREAAKLAEALARAMQLAHSRIGHGQGFRAEPAAAAGRAGMTASRGMKSLRRAPPLTWSFGPPQHGGPRGCVGRGVGALARAEVPAGCVPWSQVGAGPDRSPWAAPAVPES
jgi:hypothetical protein